MIKEMREKLAADLALIGVPVRTSWPDRVTPPLIFLQPPETGTYVVAGPNFGEYTISVDVQIVLRGRDLAKLETIVDGVLANSVDWVMLGVDSPDVFIANTQEFFGTVIHLSKPARL